LRILRDAVPGTTFDCGVIPIALEDQEERIRRGFVCEKLPLYSGPARWGPPVAAPSTGFGVLLYKKPTEALSEVVQNGGVGLFGAIEYRTINGPILLDRAYQVSAEIIAVGQSPRTEYVWLDTTATDDDGRVVATVRLQIRFMKETSPLYQKD